MDLAWRMVIMAETVSVAMSAGINFSVPHCAPAIPAIKIREQTIVKFVLYAMFCATKVLKLIHSYGQPGSDEGFHRPSATHE